MNITKITPLSRINKYLPPLAPANPARPLRPEIAAFKHEKELKEFYANIGERYLLPMEVWSNKRIDSTIKLLGKNLDELGKAGNLNIETVQKTVDKILPEDTKGKIEIKDLKDLKEDLRLLNYTEDEIKMFLKSQALTINLKGKSYIYLNFEEVNTNKKRRIDLKCDLEHEIRHCLAGKFQNTKTVDKYKNNYGICINQNRIFGKIFSGFENLYEPFINSEPVDLTQKNMLDFLAYDSIEDLHNSFDKTINALINNAKTNGELDIEDPKQEKQLYKYLKHRAHEEKIAYKSSIRYRELNDDLDTPTEVEFMPMLYEEMEKFFGGKCSKL